MKLASHPLDPALFEPAQRVRPVPSIMRMLPVRANCSVPLRPDRAFALFTREIGKWWPRVYTFSGERLTGVGIEPVAGGRWFECDDLGREIAWGDVRAFEPAQRLALTWAISARRTLESPRHASEIEIEFIEEDNGHTRVELEHRQFARQLDGEQIRAGMASPMGWPFILQQYAQAAG
jgi:uncharacterized protein YndB with AHSA1/START domain